MCRRHWFMVPKDIQRAVWTHYRAGQCKDKKPSDEYLEAALSAIVYVHKKEMQFGITTMSHEITTCGGCQAQVRWVTFRDGDRTMINKDPDPDGNIQFTGNKNFPNEVMVVAKKRETSLFSDAEVFYKSHFATCPKANEYRKIPRKDSK